MYLNACLINIIGSLNEIVRRRVMIEKTKIKSLRTNSFSKYKTTHYFEKYGLIESIDDYMYFQNWAKENNQALYILGNGSNTLFVRKKIKTLILENKLPKEIKCISEEENLYEVTSHVMMHEILNFCLKKSLDSFYYLSSVPATIGGALAMNAGEGQLTNRTIYDFVESVTYIDEDNSIKRVYKKDMVLEHRKTLFTGCQNKFIISATFKFAPKNFDNNNPIMERIQWSKQNQDNVAPNCGSVFKVFNIRILGWLAGLKIGKAEYSKKTLNWIKNNSQSHLPILTLIFVTKFLHLILGKKCKIEVIRVK